MFMQVALYQLSFLPNCFPTMHLNFSVNATEIVGQVLILLAPLVSAH